MEAKDLEGCSEWDTEICPQCDDLQQCEISYDSYLDRYATCCECGCVFKSE